MSASYRCARATAEHAEGLLALLDGAGSGCFCNYWHFDGDKNAWLEQCYLKPELNRADLRERLAGPELCGVVALGEAAAGAPPTNETAVVGWLKLARAGSVPRLYDQRVYRKLPCFEAGPSERRDVYAVGCCYVHETERGRGVTRALLSAAIDSARAAGATALEAFPRAAPGEGDAPLRPDEVWMGPEGLFLRAGFTPVSDFRPYPVLRLHLR